ncbi:MAG TPA: cell envelope integrity protein TolA [Steroidobacter sp.]|jgi:colicin import membrane protein|nr:cell envelope integrity protein TolA [Steroidobacteraceae bacterium]HLS82355.1 cell envelope integrity protein TolA [Steroidobacter sp.]
MAEFLRRHWPYLLAALLLHVLFAGLFGLTVISLSRDTPPPQLAIQAVLVDPTTLAGASGRQQVEREREQQRQREQAAEQRRQAQEETARREAEQRAEQERQAEIRRREQAQEKRRIEEQQQREREEAERKRQAEAERARQEEAERQRKAEAERKRLEEIQRKQREAEQKRRAEQEARAQAAREAELQRQLAEEEGRAQAESAGLLNQYIAMIEQRVVRNWNRPPSARPGLDCKVRVTQTPGGAVLSVQIETCNGDAAVRQSIEAAVMRASPLPPPPDPRLFERNLVLLFRPME